MKNRWALLAFAIAIICLLLTGKFFRIGYYNWAIPTIPTILFCFAAILGIPSGLFLFFYIFKFLIKPVISIVTSMHFNGNITFLIILWLGIIVIVLMCLYPPWVEIVRFENSMIRGVNPIGYSFLCHPPKESLISVIAIDRTRLFLQILIVVLITGGLLSTVKSIQLKKKQSSIN
jgi:hypothetical protein